MKLANSPLLLLAALAVGIGLGWVLFGGAEPEEQAHEPSAQKPNTRSSGVPRKPLPSRYRHLWSSHICGVPKADVAAMNAEQIVEHLLGEDAIRRLEEEYGDWHTMRREGLGIDDARLAEWRASVIE